ncbi:hypothetical protein EVAR_59790_1 [Eumeta japonica]|uniref:Uncharacterized protein n=1 Tax=Eumeta variegata TaxID=151549 RepID=A0A4C1YBY0_EUMVA|nr:hypothetical protein EVAR_59790_1 [Eumeta japonica]
MTDHPSATGRVLRLSTHTSACPTRPPKTEKENSQPEVSPPESSRGPAPEPPAARPPIAARARPPPETPECARYPQKLTRLRLSDTGLETATSEIDILKCSRAPRPDGSTCRIGTSRPTLLPVVDLTPVWWTSLVPCASIGRGH